jgi:hypothetical protein
MSGEVECQEDFVLDAGGICGKVAVEERALYQDTVASSKVMEVGSIIL